MGYLIAGHLVRRRPDPVAIRGALPSSIGFAIYEHVLHPVFAIDTYRASKPSKFPLSAATPATDLSLDVPGELAALYEQLRIENAANGLKRAYITLGQLLSRALSDAVLSVYADDDGNDFACLCQGGELVSGSARCGHRIVTFGPQGASTSLATEEPHLHQLVCEAVATAFHVPAQDLGFGSFDPPENLGFKAVADA